MDKVVNEICCSCCCHSSVCKLKDQLISIQSKVNELFCESTRSIDSETSYFICPRISCIAYKQTDNQVPKSGTSSVSWSKIPWIPNDHKEANYDWR